MRRTAILIVTLFAMLWQTVALGRVGSSVNVFSDLAHAALHWSETSHHHGDDGHLHFDQSHESSQHIHIDPVSSTVALLLPTFPLVLPAPRNAVPDTADLLMPPPDLAGLLRPPRSRA